MWPADYMMATGRRTMEPTRRPKPNEASCVLLRFGPPFSLRVFGPHNRHHRLRRHRPVRAHRHQPHAPSLSSPIPIPVWRVRPTQPQQPPPHRPLNKALQRTACAFHPHRRHPTRTTATRNIIRRLNNGNDNRKSSFTKSTNPSALAIGDAVNVLDVLENSAR
jgi:hypothetical protein